MHWIKKDYLFFRNFKFTFHTIINFKKDLNIFDDLYNIYFQVIKYYRNTHHGSLTIWGVDDGNNHS